MDAGRNSRSEFLFSLFLSLAVGYLGGDDVLPHSRCGLGVTQDNSLNEATSRVGAGHLFRFKPIADLGLLAVDGTHDVIEAELAFLLDLPEDALVLLGLAIVLRLCSLMDQAV